MPIIIKEYTWTESSTHVYLTIPLKGANPKKTDVYVNDVYVKVNFPPYFFELDLAHEVDSENAVATIGNGCAKLELPKQIEQPWTTLTHTPTSPDSLKSRRANADEKSRARIAAAQEKKLAARRERERALVQKQIEVERNAREEVARLKEEERRAAVEDLAGWTRNVEDGERRRDRMESNIRGQTSSEDKITEIFEDDDLVSTHSRAIENEYTSGPEDAVAQEPENTITHASYIQEVNDSEEDEDGLDMEEIRAKVRKQLQPKSVPPPRDVDREIIISFTSRGLKPTKTARESEDVKWETRIKAMQDEHELKQKAIAAKAAETDANGIDETNPIFLKDKGNAFYRTGNFEAAINAYSAALKLDPDSLPCLSNRAASYLHLSQHDSCIKDCTAALDLLSREEKNIIEKMINDTPAAKEQRRISRVKSLVRRGAASLKSGKRTEAVKDYTEACGIDPRNEGLKDDLAVLTLAEPLQTLGAQEKGR
ncbi:uncharacterized protein EV422DRAFT_524364 [Fimicolochytrium jonesii]|uniref:uncharacterized protein n=1 Tax=Fimicolochytrium jonesii TaxID=1396493 RepID=UPI0022FE6752|nr:uncharacterized protein EV422DRAFT_524364 [Fimicolochytrium jonesii]KAI8822538.1 hypothetical protein EV422DRAFT_524364 [Fimicolochytrium jonesii]